MMVDAAAKFERSAPAISIIVVSYNTRQITLECLRSVFAQTSQPFELM